MKRKIIERRVPKITAVVDGVLMCMRALSYVVILSTVILLMTACSFDTPWEVSDDDDLTSSSDVYIAVTFSDDGKPLKLTSLSTGDENAVADAHFYFYDTFGNYITTGVITPDNNDITTDDEGKGRYLVLLTGITDKSTPKYVLTVLNQPDNFDDSNFKQNLDDIQTVISGSSKDYGYGIYQTNITGGGKSNFVMSTSTYPHADGTYNFATGIDKNNFIEIDDLFDNTHPSASDVDPNKILTIPVERLAAKVKVNLNATLTPSLTGKTGRIGETTYSNLELYQVADNQYVELLGWKLNAISRESYMFKNIGSDWTDSNPWSGWKGSDDYRCHWAMSPNYGKGTYKDYPDYNLEGKTTDDEEKADPTDWLSPYVRYVSLDDSYDGDLHSFADSCYCPENTNNIYDREKSPDGIIDDGTSNALTAVLVKARAWEYDGDHYVPLESKTGNTEGLMYYSIPIQHLNYDNNPNTLLEGEYGVVRNHSYTLTITGVEGLGCPIENTEYVIVPERIETISLTGLSALWSSTEVFINNGEEFIDVTKAE
ncbi:MAG: fimbria major subunit [Prevotella sp.]|nr:fimbria major subunit [Prevotella sp.]